MLATLSGASWRTPIDTTGTVVTTSATAFTKGSYVQLTPGFTEPCAGIKWALWNQNTPTVDWAVLIDVAFGASGSEVIVLRDFPLLNGLYGEQMDVPFLPLHVPANTRVSVRAAGSIAGAQGLRLYTSWKLSGSLTPNESCLVTVLGLADPVTALTTGSLVTMSTTQGAFGTPVLFSSGIPHSARWIRVCPITLSGPTYRICFVEVTADAAGNEVLCGAFHFRNQGGNVGDIARGTEFQPCTIRAGTPLYVAMASDVGGYGESARFAIHLIG